MFRILLCEMCDVVVYMPSCTAKRTTRVCRESVLNTQTATNFHRLAYWFRCCVLIVLCGTHTAYKTKLANVSSGIMVTSNKDIIRIFAVWLCQNSQKPSSWHRLIDGKQTTWPAHKWRSKSFQLIYAAGIVKEVFLLNFCCVEQYKI